MAWFESNYGGHGLRDAIADILMFDCSESCMSDSGVIDRANATFFIRNAERYPWLKVESVAHSPYGGAYGTHYHLETRFDMHFIIKPEHKEAWGEFLEILNNLSDYPIIDEGIWSEVEMEVVDEEITAIAEREDADPDMLREVIYSSDIYSSVDSDGYVDFDCDMSEVVKEARRKSQTYMTHYYGGKFHSADVCSYCEEFGVSS